MGAPDYEVTLSLPQMRQEVVEAINELTEPLSLHPAEGGVLGFLETYLLLMET